jgi:acetolactate synthase-1/2/3 large subunit
MPSTAFTLTSTHTVAGVLAQTLALSGFDHCFGIPGRHVQAIFHELPATGIRTIVARHEQSAVYMADGFFRAGGKPALVTATAGPGAGNLLTGVANAFADGVPVLCLTGVAPRHFACRGAFQELGDDHTGVTPSIFAPVTRYNAQLSHQSQLAPVLRLALTALEAGGPVNLSFPADLLEVPVSPVTLSEPFKQRGAPDPDALEKAVRLLQAHPDALILAGRGALGASKSLKALAERLAIPVATTVHGRGALDEGHPLALGPQGFSASYWAENYLAGHKPSVVLALGTSLREISTNVYHPVFGGTVALIHVTSDPQAIGRHYPTQVPVVADVGLFIEALLERLSQRSPNAQLANFKTTTKRYDDAALNGSEGRISPRHVLESLRRQLQNNDILVADTGNAVPWSVRYYPVDRPGTYFASLHLAAMGWGMAAAIGMQLARPQDRVVALVGDGCFQMTGMEIATAVQHQVPVVWVVLNDARLNMVYQGSEGYYGKAIACTELSRIDCAKVAEGLGARGFRVNRPADLEPAIQAALACGYPAVVDVMIDPDLKPPMAGRFEALKLFETC